MPEMWHGEYDPCKRMDRWKVHLEADASSTFRLFVMWD